MSCPRWASSRSLSSVVMADSRLSICSGCRGCPGRCGWERSQPTRVPVMTQAVAQPIPPLTCGADRTGTAPLTCEARGVTTTLPETALPRARFLQGVRLGVPFAIAGFLVAVTFGIVARDAGLSAVAAIVMSLIVFAGSAQFAAIAILAAGGGVTAAIGAGTLMNSRFLMMGVALAPSLPGRWPWRAAQGQTVVDASWALAARGDGTFDRWLLFGSTSVQYLTWSTGTALGALGGGALGDTEKLGLDAIYPAFFVALLISEARSGRARGAAAIGALVALALVPFAPAGIPVLAASAGALLGLTQRARAEATEARA